MIVPPSIIRSTCLPKRRSTSMLLQTGSSSSILSAGIQHRVTKGFNQCQANRIIRHPNTDRFLFGQHDFRHQFGPGKHKGVGAGQIFAHEAVGGVANMTIAADIGERGAHKAEGFVFRPPFNLIYSFYCLLMRDIATYAIHGVGRVGNNPTTLKNFNGLSDQSRLRV